MAEFEKGSCASDLRLLLESGERADVTLAVGESQLRAHSFILAARSPVFAAMFRSDMREATSRRIEITDMREAVARQVLSFVYTDTAPDLASVAAEVLAAADKYDLPLLKQRCEEQMVRELSVESAAAAAGVAVLHSCPGLASAAAAFIARRPEVMATAGWARLLRDHPEAAVEVSQQVAAATSQPKTASKGTSTDTRAEVRIVPQDIRHKMGNMLLQAAWDGRVREVWALLTAGVSKDVKNAKDGDTALHLAVAKGHASTVKCLLDGGLDVNAVNKRKRTPLHLAAQEGDVNLVWMLVAASARVDAQDDQGQTPLHVAARTGNNTGDVQAVIALLLAGARKDIKDTSGETPESIGDSFTRNAFKICSDLQ